MPDRALRSKLIRLAHDNPELREAILPLLKKGSVSFIRRIQDIPKQWKFIGRLHKPDGHKLYMDMNSGLYAIADNSGRFPDQTDDGILWLKMDQDLVFEVGRRSMPWVRVDLYRADGKPARTGTNLDGAIFLADKFGWDLTIKSPEGRKLKVVS